MKKEEKKEKKRVQFPGIVWSEEDKKTKQGFAKRRQRSNKKMSTGITDQEIVSFLKAIVADSERFTKTLNCFDSSLSMECTLPNTSAKDEQVQHVLMTVDQWKNSTSVRRYVRAWIEMARLYKEYADATPPENIVVGRSNTSVEDMSTGDANQEVSSRQSNTSDVTMRSQVDPMSIETNKESTSSAMNTSDS